MSSQLGIAQYTIPGPSYQSIHICMLDVTTDASCLCISAFDCLVSRLESGHPHTYGARVVFYVLHLPHRRWPYLLTSQTAGRRVRVHSYWPYMSSLRWS